MFIFYTIGKLYSTKEMLGGFSRNNAHKKPPPEMRRFIYPFRSFIQPAKSSAALTMESMFSSGESAGSYAP